MILDIERISGLVDNVWQLRQRGYLNRASFVVDPRVICFAWKWLGDDEIKFCSEWFGDNPYGEHHDGFLFEEYPGHREMIGAARNLLDEADFVVGYNSASFDVKHLREHILKYRMDPPSPWVDVDLIKTSRSQFGFLSHSLANVLGELDMDGKADTGKGLWSRLRWSKGDDLKQARELMEKYNRQDVERTEALFYELRPWIPRLNLIGPEDVSGDFDGQLCARCGSSEIVWRGPRQNATHWYRRYQCKSCRGWGRSTKSYFHLETAS